MVNLKGFLSGAISDGSIVDMNHDISVNHSGGGKLIYIDDVLFFSYPCDILINYNIYADESRYRTLYRDAVLPELLLGTAYAPLRREFAGAHGFEQRRIMKCAGDIRELGAGALAARLIDMASKLCDNKEERRLISKRQGNVVDGKGAERVVERIMVRQ